MHRRKIALSILALAVLAACVDRTPTSARLPDESLAAASARAPVEDPDRPSELLSVRVAKRHPHFGGFSFDSAGNLIIYVTTPGHGPAVAAIQQMLVPVQKEQRGGWRHAAASPRVIVRQGEYTFGELAGYRDRVNEVAFGIRGVIFTDLDESINRVVVGVDSLMGGPVSELVASQIQSAGVPREAVVIERIPIDEDPCAVDPYGRDCYDPCTLRPWACEPPPPASDPCAADPTVSGCSWDACAVLPFGPSCNVSGSTASYGKTILSRWRPMVGAVAFWTRDSWNTPVMGTVGFSAWYCPPDDVRLNDQHCRYYYVLTAHQTQVIANMERRATFYNPHPDSTSATMGLEAYDPPWHRLAFSINPDNGPSWLPRTCQPYEGFRSVTCRRSDMALVAGTTGTQFSFGYLARPARRLENDLYWGDQFDTDKTNPWLKIAGEDVAYEGQLVDHIGAATGWRTGTIERRCVDRASTGSNSWEPEWYVMRCQAQVVWKRLEKGDSGGPVFKYSGGNALLLGIVTTKETHSYRGWYSPLANIRNDLGLPNDDRHRFRVFGTPPA